MNFTPRLYTIPDYTLITIVLLVFELHIHVLLCGFCSTLCLRDSSMLHAAVIHFKKLLFWLCKYTTLYPFLSRWLFSMFECCKWNFEYFYVPFMGHRFISFEYIIRISFFSCIACIYLALLDTASFLKCL